MRARNLKPKLFKNELLGKADPLLTILFEGLWCEADREGRLEDRPLRLCVEVFPYRRQVTEKRMDTMLQWLHEQGFIARYAVGSERFIQVLAFIKHQNPHKNERPSTIPALSHSGHSASTREEPGEHSKSTLALGLTPSSLNSDSGLLNPHSLNSDSGLLTPSSADSAAGSSTGQAAAGEHASAQGRSTRRSRGSGGKPGKEPAELRRDALKLHSAGMEPGDIAHALTQYGVTPDQVRDWVGAGTPLGKGTEGASA